MGAGLLIDHLWLVGQRDVLKSSSDTASVAATLQLRSFPRGVDDATALVALQETAERYVALNVSNRLSEEEARRAQRDGHHGSPGRYR